jgi:hypothetical protein
VKLLDGQVEITDDAAIDALEAEIRDLKQDLRRAQQVARDAQTNAAAALAPLRRQLTPLYLALQSVFGELDAAGVPEETAGYAASPNSPAPPRSATTAVWDAWKARLPGGPAKIIDTFLAHQNREMNIQQLAMATGIHRNSIPNMMTKLNKAGLIQKNGRQFALKAL